MEHGLLNWIRGNRLTNHAGVEPAPGFDLTRDMTYSTDYLCLKVPLFEAYEMKEETLVKEAKVNQRLKLIPAVRVNPRTYRILVDVNPKLHAYADVLHTSIVEPGSGDQPTIYARFRKPVDLTEFEYLIRMYLLA